MGKKRFNEKGRQGGKIIVDDSTTKNIKVDLGDKDEYHGYDESNALVLPSKKRKTKLKKDNHIVTRILSKKQRKKLEKIVDKKKKKEGRASLLEALASVQVPAEELKNYTSISKAQTIGTKNLHKSLNDTTNINQNSSISDEKISKISSIAGRSKRKRLELLAGYNDEESSDSSSEGGGKTKKIKDYNIVSLENSSSSEDEEEDDNDSNDEKEQVENNTEPSVSSIQPSQKDITEISDDTKTIQIENEPKLVPEIKKSIEIKPAIYIHVDRDPEIQAARLKLPILAEEQVIMEMINENSIIIIAGETGSGKTTQVPQFLYEAGYAEKKLIGVTEPRRVAAISMSKRVAKEMNLSEKQISYLIRFEGNVTDNTKIKFMTDGVLLKEIEIDFLLNKYSVIILDEAHERSVYTDILVGLLSRIVPLRNKKGCPLKLIIMSATLRVEDFTSNMKLFKIPPPVIKVEARQYPVTVHFQKRTADDYVKEAYKKAVKIHSKLPEGGILIFVTGQQEVNHLIRKLRKTFPCKDIDKRQKRQIQKNDDDQKIQDNNNDQDSEIEFDMRRAIRNVKKSKKKLASQISLPKIDLDNYKLPTDDTDVDLLENDFDCKMEENSDDDDNNDNDDDINLVLTKQPLWVLPLYSLLSTEKQSRIFEEIPEGCRLCVVTTNIAETSLTIPNIKYVVDTGRQKTRLYDKITGVSAFVVTFTSKASADQRAGRAGRVSAGHCYRLYSSAVYIDEFEDFAKPDIQKKPVDDLMLQMKCMGIDKVTNFPFPSPPDSVQLETAEKRLKLLGALEEVSKQNITKNNIENLTKVTPLGYAISAFPVLPRFGKMLALSHQQNLLPYTVCIVAALSVQEVLLEVSLNEDTSTNRKTKWFNKRLSWAGTGHSQLLGDPMVLLRAVGASEYAGFQGRLEEFCQENGLRSKAITEIRKLRIQLTNEINMNLSNADLSVDPKMPPPNDIQAKLLRQILLSGMGDQVAKKIPDDELHDKEAKRKFKYAYRCAEMEDPVFMHQSSVLKKKQPEWVIYQEIYELQNDDTTKMFMRGITAIEPEWLLIYAPKLCNIQAIKEEPKPPRYNSNDGKIYCYVDATFGRAGWQLPLTEIEMPLNERSCRYFGMFFLNGDIFPKLLQYKTKLKTSPTSLIKTWSNLNKFVINFTKSILSRNINSKQKILDIWKNEPKYLLEQYSELLYEVDINELSLNWPPF